MECNARHFAELYNKHCLAYQNVTSGNALFSQYVPLRDCMIASYLDLIKDLDYQALIEYELARTFDISSGVGLVATLRKYIYEIEGEEFELFNTPDVLKSEFIFQIIRERLPCDITLILCKIGSIVIQSTVWPWGLLIDVVETLAQYCNPDAIPLIQEIIQLTDEDNYVREVIEWSALFLEQVGHPDARLIALLNLKHPVEEVREAMALVCHAYGE